ncbi:hypothetical protein [Saccharibacillus sacchari]|uniref:Uncharacterized protein n=1 Tax=Saccharibacillus sacchari TaxID=456493 RepID=A0ACC6P7V4_9BACL
MKEVQILWESKNEKIVIEYLYDIEGYFTLAVYVQSGWFSGKSNFCIAQDKVNELNSLVKEVELNLEGCIKIEDCDSDAHVVIEASKLGHFNVSGQIGSSYEEQNMNFKFVADQTLLKNMSELFVKIVS